MAKLTPEQQQVLTLRGRYAQIGVAFDKSTRRLLGYRYVGRAASAGPENLRTTVPAPVPAATLEQLRERDADLVSMGLYRWTMTGLEKVES